MDIFLSNYSKNYKLESYLRDDIFKTLLVTSKKNSKLESGIPLVIKLFPKRITIYYIPKNLMK